MGAMSLVKLQRLIKGVRERETGECVMDGKYYNWYSGVKVDRQMPNTVVDKMFKWVVRCRDRPKWGKLNIQI